MMRLGAPVGAGGKKATVHFGIEGGRAEARFRAQQVAAWIVENVPNVAVEKRASSDVSDDCFAYVQAKVDNESLARIVDGLRGMCDAWGSGVLLLNEKRRVIARGSDVFETPAMALIAACFEPSDVEPPEHELTPLDTDFVEPVAGWEMDRLIDLAELRPQIERLSFGDEPIELTGTHQHEETRQLRVFCSEGGGLILQWCGEQTSRPMPAKQAVEAVRSFLRSGDLIR